jgi:hypothetical protein
MNRTIVLSVLLASISAIGLAQDSDARSLLPSAGRAQDPAQYGCFWLEHSTMTNGCTGPAKSFEIPLTMDGDGLYTVTVTARGASTSNNVGCLATGIDRSGTAFAGPDPRKFLEVFNAPHDLVTRAWHWGGGGVYVNCQVDLNARINVVRW